MTGLWLAGLDQNVTIGYLGKTVKAHTPSKIVFDCGSWVEAQTDLPSGRVWGMFAGTGKLAIARGVACNPAICDQSYSFMSASIKLSWASKMEDSARHGPDFVEFFDQSSVRASGVLPVAHLQFYGRGLFVLESFEELDLVDDALFAQLVKDLVGAR